MAENLENAREQARGMAETARSLAEQAEGLAASMGDVTARAAEATGTGAAEYNVVLGLTVFVLAIFVGYHVVWRVTPALHSPLMSVTNAVSSVIVVGALVAAGPADYSLSHALGLAGILLASVNIFGGFIVTQRMLAMFQAKK